MNCVKLMLAAGLLVSGITGCSLSSVTRQSQTSQETQYWTLDQVVDGDTLTVTQGAKEEKIRLCGIDAPEMEQPLGKASRDHLQQIVDQAQNFQLGVVPVERDRYGWQVAEVFVMKAGGEEIHVNSQMVADSMAYVYDKYVDGCPNGSVIERAGAQAEQGKQGVWSGNQVKPWDFRPQNRK